MRINECIIICGCDVAHFVILSCEFDSSVCSPVSYCGNPGRSVGVAIGAGLA